MLNRRVVLHAIDARCAPDALVDFHTGLDAVENRRDGGQRRDAQVLRFPRSRKISDVRREENNPGRPPQPGRRPLADGRRRYEAERSPEALLPESLADP